MSKQEWFMDLQEAVMSMRKAAYEFGCADNPEDHALMLKYQRAIFDIVTANTSAPTIRRGSRWHGLTLAQRISACSKAG